MDPTTNALRERSKREKIISDFVIILIKATNRGYRRRNLSKPKII